jgi:hypothetical protein
MSRNADYSLSSVLVTSPSRFTYSHVVVSSLNRSFLRYPDSPGFHETHTLSRGPINAPLEKLLAMRLKQATG